MSDKFTFRVKKRRPEEIYDGVLDYYKKERLIQYASSKNIMRIKLETWLILHQQLMF